jgi:hypothetical protein
VRDGGVIGDVGPLGRKVSLFAVAEVPGVPGGG